jgi:hypothetical protein
MFLKRNRWMTIVIAASLSCALVLAGVACGDDDENGDGNGDGGDAETAAIEQSVTDAIAAWNAMDVETLLARFTDQGAIEAFGGGGETIEEVRAGLPEFIGSEPIEMPEFSGTSADGETGETTVQWTLGAVYERNRFPMVLQGEEWKIDGQEPESVEVPDGYTTIDVDLDEFSFTFDTAAASEGGQIAFAAENVGEQEHELGLARIPADADINELLMSEEEPEGLEFFGAVFASPGETPNLVLTEPLDAGRYIFVCFLPDTEEGVGEDGTPHAFKGMVSEFTVE